MHITLQVDEFDESWRVCSEWVDIRKAYHGLNWGRLFRDDYPWPGDCDNFCKELLMLMEESDNISFTAKDLKILILMREKLPGIREIIEKLEEES